MSQRITESSRALTEASGRTGSGAADIAHTVEELSQAFQTHAVHLSTSMKQLQDLDQQVETVNLRVSESKARAHEGRMASDAGLTHAAFETIRTEADATDALLAVAVGGVEALHACHRTLTDGIIQVSAGIQQAAAGAQEVSATTSEQEANVQRINRQLHDLLGMTQQLEALTLGDAAAGDRSLMVVAG